jgi:Mn-dependent DtxR family transcriptional regulator
MSKPRPLPTTWEELRIPQRHLMRVLATMEYDPDDAYALAKVVWPTRDHLRVSHKSGRYMTEWGVTQQLRYLRSYGFVEKTGPIFLTELGRKVYNERWDREIDRLLGLRSFLSNDPKYGWCLVDDENTAEATDEQLAVAFTEWLDKEEQINYLTREWEKESAWKTESTRFSPSTP